MEDMGKYHDTIYDAKEAIINKNINEAIKVIKEHISNEHGIDSDFSKIGMYIHAHRLYLERALKLLNKYKEKKQDKYLKQAEQELDDVEDINLLLYEFVDKLRRDLLHEE